MKRVLVVGCGFPQLSLLRAAKRLRVIGRQAPQWLLDLAAEQPENVLVEGFVADLDDALSGAAAMLNPARFGTGVKIKVIERPTKDAAQQQQES